MATQRAGSGQSRGLGRRGVWVAELDLTPMTPWQRRVLYCAQARQAGVDPAGRPFGVVQVGDRRVLYAVEGLVAALVVSRGITTTVLSPPRYALWEGQHMMVCTVRAEDAEGRVETSSGAVRWRPWGPGGDLAERSVARATGRAVLALAGVSVLDAADLPELPVLRPPG